MNRHDGDNFVYVLQNAAEKAIDSPKAIGDHGVLVTWLPERLVGLYRALVQQWRPFVHAKMLKYSTEAVDFREEYWTAFPFICEYAFVFGMCQLKEHLPKWNIPLTGFPNIDTKDSALEQLEFYQKHLKFLMNTKKYLQNKVTESLNAPKYKLYASPKGINDLTGPQEVALLSQLLEEFEFSGSQYNFRYQFTRGLLYFLQDNYLAAGKHLKQAQQLYTTYDLGSSDHFAHYVAPCSARESLVEDSFSSTTQYSWAPRDMICGAVPKELINHFTLKKINRPYFYCPTDADASKQEAVGPNFEDVLDQISKENLALNNLGTTLLQCCHLGLTLPNFTNTLCSSTDLVLKDFFFAQDPESDLEFFNNIYCSHFAPQQNMFLLHRALLDTAKKYVSSFMFFAMSPRLLERYIAQTADELLTEHTFQYSADGHLFVGSCESLLGELLQERIFYNKHLSFWHLQEGFAMHEKLISELVQVLRSYKVYIPKAVPSVSTGQYQKLINWEQWPQMLELPANGADAKNKAASKSSVSEEPNLEFVPAELQVILLYNRILMTSSELLVNMTAYPRRMEYEVNAWIHRYVHQRIKQQQTLQPKTKQKGAKDTNSEPPISLLTELDQPLIPAKHLEQEGQVLFVPVKPKVLLEHKQKGTLPEYQSLDFTPLQLDSFHRGELFGADHVTAAMTITGKGKAASNAAGTELLDAGKITKNVIAAKVNAAIEANQAAGAEALSSRYDIYFGGEFKPFDFEMDANSKTIADYLPRFLCSFLGKSWVEQHFHEAKVLAKGAFGARLTKEPVQILTLTKSNSDLLTIDWSRPFVVKVKDLPKLRYAYSWQRFFGASASCDLFYRYTLHSYVWPEDSAQQEEEVSCFVSSSEQKTALRKASKQAQMEDLLCEPARRSPLSQTDYQQVIAKYPLREDVYYGRTACYQLLSEYYQGNQVVELDSDTLNSNMSRLLQMHANAGFIYVDLAQLQQKPQGAANSAVEAGSVAKVTKGRGRKAAAKASPEVASASAGTTAASTKTNNGSIAGDVDLSVELLSQAQQIWDRIQGPQSKPAKRSAKATKTTAAEASSYSDEVRNMAYALSFLKDLGTELKAKLDLEVDVIGYALGHKYLYLDLLIWDWHKFLEQATDLSQSPLIRRYGVTELNFHSFVRESDNLPLTIKA